MLLGIIYARDLQQYEAADDHLTKCLDTIVEPNRREQCAHWLGQVRGALDRPAPEV